MNIRSFDILLLKQIHLPSKEAHKGQNGKVLIIGGSHFFHAASLWSLTIASRIVDLVHYASVPENNEIVQKAKEEFRNGIVVPRSDIERYVIEDNSILIGPGMVRSDPDVPVQTFPKEVHSVQEALSISDEGMQTKLLSEYLFRMFPDKQWIIDAGSLQMVDPEKLPRNSILTPHMGEFISLEQRLGIEQTSSIYDRMSAVAKRLQTIVVLKGPTDIVCNGSTEEIYTIEGGNEGMTKGGTGDVLAALITALSAKNDPFLSAIAGSYINKYAGDQLYKTVGPFFNTSDLADQIPKTMKELFFTTL